MGKLHKFPQRATHAPAQSLQTPSLNNPIPIVVDDDGIIIINGSQKNQQQQQQKGSAEGNRATCDDCDTDPDDPDTLCGRNEPDHVYGEGHHASVVNYLRIEWGLTRPQSFIRRLGIEVVNEAAQELADGLLGPFLNEDGSCSIRSRPRFANYTIQQTADDHQTAADTDVSKRRQAMKVVGGSAHHQD